MKSKLRTAFALRAGDWALLGRAWHRLLLADLALRLLPLPKVQSMLAQGQPGARTRRTPAPLPRLARFVDLAARHHVLPVRCLQRAVALQSLLLDEGIRTELRIGVLKQEGSLAAHAWLERAGEPVGDSPESLAPFLSLQPVESVSAGPR